MEIIEKKESITLTPGEKNALHIFFYDISAATAVAN